jgi:uncharacterized protein
MDSPVTLSKDAIAQFCQRHHIRYLAFFGSVLRDDFTPDSDVDVLVEFEPGHVPDFFALHDIEQELSALLGGRKADLVTPKFLNRHIRAQVLQQAEVQYEQLEEIVASEET